MKIQPEGRWLPLVLLASLLPGAAGLAQQKHPLRAAYAAGDRATVDAYREIDVKYSVAVPGREPQTLRFTRFHTESYTEVVLSAEPTGRTGIRRTYSLARTEELDPQDRIRATESALQGNAVAVRRRGDEVIVTSARGALGAADRQSLSGVLRGSAMDLLPAADAAPGEEWEVGEKGAAWILRATGADEAVVRAEFREITSFGGHPCARIRLTAETVGPSAAVGAGATLTARLSGDLYFALDLRRELGLELAGPVGVRGLQAGGVDARGGMRVKETLRWHQVAGRPLATGTPAAGAAADAPTAE